MSLIRFEPPVVFNPSLRACKCCPLKRVRLMEDLNSVVDIISLSLLGENSVFDEIAPLAAIFLIGVGITLRGLDVGS